MVYVFSALLLAERLGFALFQILAVSGQLLSGLAVDGVGLLHIPKRPPTLRRVLAVAAVLGGAVLVGTSAGLGSESSDPVGVRVAQGASSSRNPRHLDTIEGGR